MKIQLSESELRAMIMEAIEEANIDRTDLFKDDDTDEVERQLYRHIGQLGAFRGYENDAYPELSSKHKEMGLDMEPWLNDEKTKARDVVDAATAELKYRKQNPSYKTPSKIRAMMQDLEDNHLEDEGLNENRIARLVREAVEEAVAEAKKQKAPKKMTLGTVDDFMKANRKGSRDAEFEIKGPGFHSNTKSFKNQKKYDRKRDKKVNLNDNE